MAGFFQIRTFGCQMNQHDAEKMSNLLYHAGLRPAEAGGRPDLVVVHTCSIREKAEQKLYSELGALLARKRAEPDLVVGVGGCVAQQEGAELLRRFPALDFVFGAQHLDQLPAMVANARARVRDLRVDHGGDPQARFDLPELHPEYTSQTPGRAFVTVMEGCDLFCTYCVVPRTRGREVSRSSRAILEEVRTLADRGVLEVTLLGQTVNAYGRRRPGRVDGEIPFGELIRRVGAVAGIQRVRFTSPHPSFVTPDLLCAYANVPELCPHIHLPVQSGSSRVLAAMNRRYTRDGYLQVIAALRRARPDIAITTDIIVGFPGETRGEFDETLELLGQVAFVDSFSFKYSARPGTPAERRRLVGVEPREAQERLEEVQSVQRVLTLAAHERRVGEVAPVLVEGASRRGGQLSGRGPYNRIVNFATARPVRPGQVCDVRITAASRHSLLGAAVSTQPLELPLI
ncbi:MAG: tRNA (N6-isopentenyl adenosine(37)-C2)-methylthiotransferase MiaB [Myxococcota bacterium]